ncbi:translation initiation factor eIF-2B subunit alpha [Lithohypha guttulata]|uniref:translation initiation factor eIF-2B subunit alpha n=1 Tax=Lithohypha guttulata TaxID=1690604 RepID=UPI002DDEDFA6|nr:translation initiation factor eIF-2B subunit alpha [Lithohypha guttulata]KAK5103370.1 translation initiation factor eIF-2B subunit alpha [Lithohypha guttulata]
MAASSRTGLATPPIEENNAPSFDIVAHYTRFISSDPSITPAIAAIESLIASLSASSLTTISETLALLKTQSNTLLASQSNPIPLSAGTELLQRYIITVVQQQPTQLSGHDFSQLRRQLIANSKLFVSRTKSARSKIAKHALPFIRDQSTIFVYGSSRVIDAVLDHAAESRRYFNVVFISSLTSDPIHQSLKRLLSLGIPVATIPLPALSHAIDSLDRNNTSNVLFLLGAEAVLENGAAVSNIGSRLVASVAKTSAIPCYFAAESYKFTRQFPTSFGDADLQAMGAKQQVLKFRNDLDGEKMELQVDAENQGRGDGMVDITPPSLIGGLITENGVMTAEGVAEELIKLWF